MKKSLAIAALGLLAVPLIHVYQRSVSTVSLVCWLGAIIVSVIFWYQKDHREKQVRPVDYRFLSVAALVGLILLYLFTLIPTHFHQDEFITAYTSMMLPPFRIIDWFASVPKDWVSQFPVLFHVLQKPFLMLLGPTITAIRISVWPYYVLSIVYVYILARLIAGKFTARIAVLSYIFLAPNIYLSSMGLHFISSTAFYLAAITELLLSIKENSRTHAIASGIWCGLGFLTYTGSYLAFPVVLVIGITHLAFKRSKKNLLDLAALIWMTVIITAPFFLYAFHVHNFFLERIDEVQTISGSWSKTADMVAQGNSLVSVLTGQAGDALRALYTPGIGGHGGYNFGHLALFDPFTAILIAAGFIMVIFKKNWYGGALLFAILVPFISGYLLTIPPPAFHRLAVLFPLLSILIAAVIAAVVTVVPKKWAILVAIVILAVYASSNIRHAFDMTVIDSKENLPGSMAVTAYLKENVKPDTTVYIAAFESYHLVKELYFRTQGAYRFITEPIPTLLHGYRGEPVIILYTKPEDIAQLASKYPHYTQITDTYNGYPLNELTIFSTGQ